MCESLFSADEMDALSGRIEDLVSLMESSDVLTDEQKNMILRRNERAICIRGVCRRLLRRES